jgi:3-oxo-5-alpha-steroid 4-dehydrogenase 1
MNIDVQSFYDQATFLMLCIPALIFPILLIINAPYGRHSNARWGPTVPAQLGWILMELPAPVFFALGCMSGPNALMPIPLFFFVLFMGHYVHRSVIYPLLMRNPGSRSAAFIVFAALAFNSMNGMLCGLAVGHIGDYGASWARDPRFIFGTLLFVAGAAINLHSDAVLRGLRKPGETGYRIPHGGFYRWVSCPNYLGEIVEWFGFAIATWSPAGLAFALMTVANLMPRARSNHLWYRETFADYPEDRRALIPRLF